LTSGLTPLPSLDERTNRTIHNALPHPARKVLGTKLIDRTRRSNGLTDRLDLHAKGLRSGYSDGSTGTNDADEGSPDA